MVTVIDGVEIHVTHTMADGRTLESVKGYLTDINQLSPVARTLLRQMLENLTEDKNEEI